MNTISLGMDPDVHACAFAQVTETAPEKYDLKVYVVRQKEGKSREAALALIQQDAFEIAIHGPEGCPSYPDILVAEGQDVRYAGQTSRANPQDVMSLAYISGAALAVSVSDTKYCPLPREWKGTVKKDIKQKRVLTALGIKYEMKGGKDPYPVPVDFQKYCVGKVNAGDWKDLTDAAGLALWGLLKFKEEQRRHDS